MNVSFQSLEQQHGPSCMHHTYAHAHVLPSPAVTTPIVATAQDTMETGGFGRARFSLNGFKDSQTDLDSGHMG